LLDANEFKRGCVLAGVLEAEFDHLVYSLHECVEVLRLGMATPQSGHSSNVVALLVPFD
jgi:hypothetical protein